MSIYVEELNKIIRARESRKKYTLNHPKEVKESNLKYKEKNKEKLQQYMREYRYKYDYGITKEEFENFLTKQNKGKRVTVRFMQS